MIYVREFRRENLNFASIIKLFLVLVIVNALIRLYGTFVPVALMFGPLQYYAHSLSKGRPANSDWLYHLLPFLLVSVLFQFFGAPLYLGVLTVSTLAYSVYIWADKGVLKSKQAERVIILQIAAVSAIASVFVGILFLLSTGVVQRAGVGFDPSYVLYGLLLVASTILFAYFLTNKHASFQPGSASASICTQGRTRYDTYNMDESVLKSYANHIETVISERKLYLNAALSMDDLLHETGIPKHHLSQVFTVCLGKPFYQYIAEKRIEEAKSRMKRNANITLEFLAFECGFNSKTTFNKYFKQISSVTPSEYRSSLNAGN